MMESPIFQSNFIKEFIDKSNVLLKSLEANLKEAVDYSASVKEELSKLLQRFNKLELQFLVDCYLATRVTLDPSPEFTQHTRTQFIQLIAHRCPPASSELRILLADVQQEVPLLHSKWFSNIAERMESVIISPIRARLDRIENGTEQIVLFEVMEQDRRDYFEVAIDLKNVLISVSNKLKETEEKIEELKAFIGGLLQCSKMITSLEMLCALTLEMKRVGEEKESLQLEESKIDEMEEGQKHRKNLKAITNKGHLLFTEMGDDFLKMTEEFQLIKGSEWLLAWCKAFGPILCSAIDRFSSTV